MSNLVMPIGGIGAQNSVTDPVVVDKEDWQTYGPSAFMASDGGHLVYYDDPEIDYSGSNPVVLGDFSALTPIVNTAGATIYAFLSYIIQDGSLPISGYFKILSASSTGLEIEATALDGFTITEPSSTPGWDADYIRVGGAGHAIELADLYIGQYIVTASNDTLEHSVTVLTNLDETYDASVLTLSTGSTDLHRIQYIGKKHGTGVEYDDCEKWEDYPEIKFTGLNAYVAVTTSFIYFKHIYVNSDSTSNQLFYNSTGNFFVMDSCKVFHDYSAASGSTIGIGYFYITNSHIISYSTNSTHYTVNTSGRNTIDNCFISSKSNGVRFGTGYVGNIKNCIIVGNGSGRGIESNISYGFSYDISNNIISNFATGIYSNITVTDYSWPIKNNIIWGADPEMSIGIYNNASATRQAKIYVKNNFIGNVVTVVSGFDNIDTETIALTVNPFKNASGNLNVPSDFYLNDTEGGGALIKANYQPTDYDLDGTRDNYQYGPIMEEVTSGGGGGVSASRIFGGL